MEYLPFLLNLYRLGRPRQAKDFLGPYKLLENVKTPTLRQCLCGLIHSMQLSRNKKVKIMKTPSSNLFQYCYVNTTENNKPIGSYVVTTKNDGEIIFSRTVDLLNKTIIETNHRLGDEFAEFKEALEFHFNLDFIFSDCIVLSIEVVQDLHGYAESDVLCSNDEYGNQVYYSDLECLDTKDGEIDL